MLVAPIWPLSPCVRAGLWMPLLLALAACQGGRADSGLSVAERDAGMGTLLGSTRAQSYMEAYCQGQPDAAVLPADPRSLVRPGVNAGRAVAFNAYWQDCTGPADNPDRSPQTCGEYRQRLESGRVLLHSGLINQGSDGASLSAEDYNNIWQRWGLSSRPADFDAQLRERYGLPPADFHNPYPLPGEDPLSSNGGSGQLPAGLAQTKDAQGNYNGTIGITCDVCHSGQLGLLAEHDSGAAFVAGLGAHTADFHLLMTDTAAPLPLGFNASRGVTNAEGLSGLLIGLLDVDSLGFSPETTLLMQLPGNTSGAGDTKMPAWWNASHRPRKFWDGGFSYDASRLDTAILNAGRPPEQPFGNDKDYNLWLRDKIEHEGLEAQVYIESLRSPAYPGPVDQSLAQQGAILFHAKDLWADGGNADIPRPQSNGSCAGCHGVYAEHYAQDPAYLEDPRLRGIAAYISPLEQIRTDPERIKGFTPALLELMSTSWFSYPEGSPGYVSPEDKTAFAERQDDFLIFSPGARPAGACTWQGFAEEDVVGYLAPPLHGVWATAPYLHNGSVPDVWGILQPEDRPAVWRRALVEGAGAERGFDTSAAAYDFERMGWRYEEMVCSGASIPYLGCEPEAAPDVVGQIVSAILNLPGQLNSVGYQVMPAVGRDAVEARKVFNSYQFAKSNAGHDFTRVLTDRERLAILEYLKTL